jgi:hypothetical protein
MKFVTVKDKEGGYNVFEFYLNDDMEITVEHQDGRVDIVVPERLCAEIQADKERLEAQAKELQDLLTDEKITVESATNSFMDGIGGRFKRLLGKDTEEKK